jgi:glucosamine--fructose-6-phosphate aminotransferase (isomerizing)
MKFDNPTRQQVFSLPELLASQYRDLEPKARSALTTPEIFGIRRILLTGCGDSFAAALAARHIFARLTGIPTEVVTAIDLARFYDEGQLGFAPWNPLIIAVSNSGKVTRVAEAVRRGTRRGCLGLAITGNPDSALGEAASRTLRAATPPFESNASGARTYLTAVLALLLLAIRVGEVRGRYTMDTATAWRNAIPALAARLADALPVMDEAALALAGEWREKEAFDFVGAGPDYAAAWFGHVKVFEALGRYGTRINTEEWLHINFFARRVQQIGTVLVAGGQSPARSRTVEFLNFANQMGRPLLVISDDLKDLPLGAARGIAVPPTPDAMLQPLAQFIPICLLVGYIAGMIGEEEGRGCQGPWAFAANGAGIHRGETILL